MWPREGAGISERAMSVGCPDDPIVMVACIPPLYQQQRLHALILEPPRVLPACLVVADHSEEPDCGTGRQQVGEPLGHVGRAAPGDSGMEVDQHPLKRAATQNSHFDLALFGHCCQQLGHLIRPDREAASWLAGDRAEVLVRQMGEGVCHGITEAQNLHLDRNWRCASEHRALTRCTCVRL